MLERMQILKCNDCGVVLEVLDGGECEVACCGKTLNVLEERTADVGKEKHVPVCEQTSQGLTVKVGSVPHPMEQNHYIEWIEVVADGKVSRQFLKPGDAPEATFPIKPGKLSVREHCNLHGLWTGQHQ